MANSCKYYTEKTLAWMLNNKLIVFLSLLCFCFFVSTWALAAQKNRALSRIDDLNAQLASTTTTTTTSPTTTAEPTTTINSNPEQPENGETGGSSETEGNGGTGNNGTEESEANNETGRDEGTGNSGVITKSKKSNAEIDENKVDQEDINYALESEENLRSIIQKSKLLAALAT